MRWTLWVQPNSSAAQRSFEKTQDERKEICDKFLELFARFARMALQICSLLTTKKSVLGHTSQRICLVRDPKVERGYKSCSRMLVPLNSAPCSMWNYPTTPGKHKRVFNGGSWSITSKIAEDLHVTIGVCSPVVGKFLGHQYAHSPCALQLQDWAEEFNPRNGANSYSTSSKLIINHIQKSHEIPWNPIPDEMWILYLIDI